ncbi:MAG TPA: methyltransferase [Blastocatellia bacterium]|nr:methyltransferase [Blastocatellia bacterium]
MTREPGHLQVTPDPIVQLLWAPLATQALIAGVELEVFTHISHGRRTAREVARAAGASLRGIEPLLDALVSMGYLNKKGDRYGLETISQEFLVRGKPSYMGDMIYSTKLTQEHWMRLTDSVRTGRPVESVDLEDAGREFFPKLVTAIFPMSFSASRAAVAALPEKSVKRIKSILDVAAGSAAWSIPFALANPEAKVTVLDFPEVTMIASQFARNFGLVDRYSYVEGNLREVDFGRDKYDLVILGHIIHSEGEKWGKRLLKKSYRALIDGGMLLIGEMIPNDARTGPPFPLLFGLNMLIHTTEGGVYTMKQYREWLKEAGFKRVITIDAPAPSPLILAIK